MPKRRNDPDIKLILKPSLASLALTQDGIRDKLRPLLRLLAFKPGENIPSCEVLAVPVAYPIDVPPRFGDFAPGGCKLEGDLVKRQRKSSGRMASKGFPNPIDVHVGNRIRLRRTLLGLSQERLADALGLTFQQVQKYERGSNRVSSSRLYDLARTLDASLSYFFEEMSASVAAQTPSKLLDAKKLTEIDEVRDPMARRETLELVRAYYRIADPAVRKQLYNLVKTVAKAAQD